MERINMGIYLLTFLFVFAHCKNKQQAGTYINKEESPVKVALEERVMREITVNKSLDPDSLGTKVKIDSVAIIGDQLVLLVNYSGGCAEHKFELRFDGSYMKSMPPKATLFLAHDDGGDHCRQMKKELLKFDVTKLRNERSDSVTLLVAGYKPTLSYRYQR